MNRSADWLHQVQTWSRDQRRARPSLKRVGVFGSDALVLTPAELQRDLRWRT